MVTPLATGVAAALALCLLAGCQGSPPANAKIDPKQLSTLSLAQTKSPVQLLRNDALARVEQRFVAETSTTDGSEACFTEQDNPEGLVRQWHSTGELELTNDADAGYIAERLVQSFTGDGWDDSGEGDIVQLSSDRSVASITISSSSAAITVTVTGPCVTTDGPDSDEVLDLE